MPAKFWKPSVKFVKSNASHTHQSRIRKTESTSTFVHMIHEQKFSRVVTCKWLKAECLMSMCARLSSGGVCEIFISNIQKKSPRVKEIFELIYVYQMDKYSFNSTVLPKGSNYLVFFSLLIHNAHAQEITKSVRNLIYIVTTTVHQNGKEPRRKI